ncbi:siderophore-interacting protein [Ancylobacter sp. 6x-1]|uniref:Siderophore-interacting protein n=1 Tax=Ancylobacter crimeensis TaxID=2579147 RepID=A0ABT0DAH7_9HYPH|nr:siderophore-interacting protein [Ancylobacter crimeensis]MCK0196961.1 siderophore-interacting protein [Ancylobacter crimeensis]
MTHANPRATPRPMPFRDRVRLELPRADFHAAQIAEHMGEHGALVANDGAVTRLDFDFFGAELETADDMLEMRAYAADSAFLQEIRALLGEHLAEFSGRRANSLLWEEAGRQATLEAPPNFRLMEVVAVRDLTPHMRRITLAGENLLRFSGDRDLHCKLLIPPPPPFEPEWPRLDSEGRFQWPQGAGKPVIRKYTIRSVDLEASTLDIDFVLHDVPGPGAGWAARAVPGARIGMVGPGGLSGIAAEICVLAGDETALPLIARLAENLPATSRAVALIEVADAREEQPICSPAQLDIRWLHRDGAAPGTTTLIEDALRGLDWPDAARSVSVVAGCEHEAALRIRTFLRSEMGMTPKQALIVSYWRRGRAGEA